MLMIAYHFWIEPIPNYLNLLGVMKMAQKHF